jgi:myo-inositol 2-dehydrogenase / D-chiro-inositol 1-dehydrogenase
MAKIGFGIIGSGGIATTAHIPSLLEIPDAQLIAISGTSVEKARAAAAHVESAAAYGDNQQVIDHPAVEAVVLCMPPKWHAEWAVKAAQAGKHVLCEKPMACSLAECDAMIAACKAAGVQLMVAEMKRFNPGFRKAKELLDQGVIGEIFLARYHNSYFEPHTRQGWWTDTAISGGGEMMNELTHQVNVMRWLLGPVTEVGCMSNHPQGPMPEDNAVVSLRFQSDAVSVVTISWMTKSYNVAFPAPLEHAWDERIDLFGSQGSLRIQTPFTYWRTPIELLVYTDKSLPSFSRGWNVVRCAPTAHYVEQLRHFIRCIKGQDTCEVPGEEGRADLAVVLAAMDAAETGRTITLGS